MNLVVDYGNTRIKAGIFEELDLKEKHVFDKEKNFLDFLASKTFTCAIVSSVVRPAEALLSKIVVKKKKMQINHRTPLPIRIRYDTPHTLGVDRIAVVCGASDYAGSRNRLVIDMGTCITFNLLSSENVYLGGAISPGIHMRYNAMHTFTSKLPLLAPDYSVGLVASATESSMHSGVIHGVLAEIEGIIDRYMKEYTDIATILCGGDSLIVKNKFKHNPLIIPDLSLMGLNKVLLYNVTL